MRCHLLIMVWRVLVEVSNNMLTRADFQYLWPRGKIDNMVMLFANGMIVYNQLHI